MTEKQIAAHCDAIIQDAAEKMLAAGASPQFLMDRLLTYCAASLVSWEGSRQTAQTFQTVAVKVDGGLFAHLDKTRVHRKQ